MLVLQFLTANEDTLLGVIRVGNNKVRVLACFDRADLVLYTQGLCGVIGCGTDSLFLSNTPGNRIGQASPEVGCGSGDGLGANQFRDTAADLCHLAAQIKLVTLGLACTATGVGNQHHTILEHRKCQADRRGMNMIAITDDLRLDSLILHTGRNHTGIAVVDSGHSIV